MLMNTNTACICVTLLTKSKIERYCTFSALPLILYSGEFWGIIPLKFPKFPKTLKNVITKPFEAGEFLGESGDFGEFHAIFGEFQIAASVF